jgi:general secretion pathway protein G
MLLPQLVLAQDSAQVLRAKQDVRALVTAVNLFKHERGRLPTNDEGFAILVASPTERRPVYLKAIPVDPWGRPYFYAIPGRAGDYEIYTLGADGRSGGDGDDADIGSWLADALKPPR